MGHLLKGIMVPNLTQPSQVQQAQHPSFVNLRSGVHRRTVPAGQYIREGVEQVRSFTLHFTSVSSSPINPFSMTAKPVFEPFPKA